MYDNEAYEAVSLGMGKTSLTSDLSSSVLFSNPARLSEQENINTSFSGLTRKFKYNEIRTNGEQSLKIPVKNYFNTKFSQISLAVPLKMNNGSQIGVGAGYRMMSNLNFNRNIYYTYDDIHHDIDYTDTEGSLNHFSFGLGYRANDRFSIGTSYHIGMNSKAKIVSDIYENTKQTSKFNYFTLSGIYHITKNYDVHFAYKSEYTIDVASKYTETSSSFTYSYNDNLLYPEEWTIGLSAHYDTFRINGECSLPYYMRMNQFNGWQSYDKNGKKLRLGLEKNFSVVSLRTGAYLEDLPIGIEEIGTYKGLTLGVGINHFDHCNINIGADFSKCDDKLYGQSIDNYIQKYLVSVNLNY